MLKRFLKPVRSLMQRAGFDIVRYRKPVADDATSVRIESADAAIAEAVAPYTMTSPERIQATIDAVRYVCRYRIPGSLVECGVWRGGSTMAMAKTLLDEGDTGRDLFLFDTFEGMSPPTDHDRDHTGASAAQLLGNTSRNENWLWCYAALDEVRANLAKTGYPMERFHLVPGKVEETIPHAGLAGPIAVLRLDTDWYESTRHELMHLFPLLAPGGVLIVDDYGYWRGARRAVDEFLAANPDVPLLLQRTDFTGRMAVKPRLLDGTSHS